MIIYLFIKSEFLFIKNLILSDLKRTEKGCREFSVRFDFRNDEKAEKRLIRCKIKWLQLVQQESLKLLFPEGFLFITL